MKNDLFFLQLCYFFIFWSGSVHIKKKKKERTNTDMVLFHRTVQLMVANSGEKSLEVGHFARK